MLIIERAYVASIFFLFYYYFLETNEQHTAADLVNYVYSRLASSDQTDFIRDSNKMSKGK